MNDALTLPFFSHSSSSFSHTPPFPDNYESAYTNDDSDYYHGYNLDTNDGGSTGIVATSSISNSNDRRSNGLGSYTFPTPPSTSHSNGTFSNQPTFNPSSSSTYMSNFYTNPSFLDVGVNVSRPNFADQAQPGPSNYTRSNSSGEEYLRNDDDEDDLVKMEERRKAEEEAQGFGGEDQEDGEVDNEEPLYVNAKQYHRILKRRAARQRLDELNRLARSRKPYLHESRHRHACSRPRGKGGRFLTADEIEALRKEEAAKASGIPVSAQ